MYAQSPIDKGHWQILSEIIYAIGFCKCQEGLLHACQPGLSPQLFV